MLSGQRDGFVVWSMVRRVPSDHRENGHKFIDHGQQYTWYEMSYFRRRDYPDRCKVLCIDMPIDLHTEQHAVLRERPALNLQDPFSMHQTLIDQVIDLYDILVWQLGDHVRVLEKVNALQYLDAILGETPADMLWYDSRGRTCESALWNA